MDQNNAPASSPIFSILALVCGIIGVAGGLLGGSSPFCIVALVLAIIGIIFGAIGMKKAKASGKGKGMAVAGLILGIIGTAFGIVGVICYVACWLPAQAALNELGTNLNELAGLLD